VEGLVGGKKKLLGKSKTFSSEEPKEVLKYLL
jgi:hypothetical protein